MEKNNVKKMATRYDDVDGLFKGKRPPKSKEYKRHGREKFVSNDWVTRESVDYDQLNEELSMLDELDDDQDNNK